MITDPAIATAADYADALITARRSKNVIILILLLLVLIQLTLFILVRAGYLDLPGATGPSAAAVDPLLQQAVLSDAATQPAATAPVNEALNNVVGTRATSTALDWAKYLIGASVFLGVTLSIVLALVLLLIVMIMLVGRLIGVSRLTSAFIWSLILLVFLFPWQAFLANATFTSPEFKIPGVLYNWEEFQRNANFSTANTLEAILKWARFVAFPVIAIIMLLLVQIKSNRGLKQALGEADVITETTTVTRGNI